MSAPVFAAATAAPFNPLLVMILVPLIGAAVVALMPKARADLVRQVAVIFSLISGA